jgi:RHS repeat-associated protein
LALLRFAKRQSPLKKENKSHERNTAAYTLRLKVEYYSNTKALINSSVQDFSVSSGVWVNLSPNNIQISQNNVAFVKFIVINPNSFPIFIDDWSIKESGKVILQENHYYPYGKKISSLGKKGTHEFLYQGKERMEELGLHWDDFEWRNYDITYFRTLTIDPKAEKFFDWSPYSWAMSNPINTIDPDGREVYFLNGADAMRVIQDLNKIFRKTYGLDYDVFKIEQREVSVTKTVKEKANFEWSSPDTWDGEIEKEVQIKEMRSYIKTDNEGDFDWDKNKYTEATFDIFNSTEVVLRGELHSSDKDVPRTDGALGGKLKNYGGGFSFKTNRVFWLDDNPSRGTAGGWLLHETVYHFHPLGNEDTKKGIGSKGLQEHFGLPISNNHGGNVITNWSNKEIQRLKRLRQKNK